MSVLTDGLEGLNLNLSPRAIVELDVGRVQQLTRGHAAGRRKVVLTAIEIDQQWRALRAHRVIREQARERRLARVGRADE